MTLLLILVNMLLAGLFDMSMPENEFWGGILYVAIEEQAAKTSLG